MNNFKIEVKEILKRDVLVKAKTEEQALKIIENILLKSNILDLNAKDLKAVEVKILEKNGEKIDSGDLEFEDEFKICCPSKH